jgi:hypothetical protein
MNAAEPIDGSTATPAELRRAGIDALMRALGPVGMARFLQQFDPGHGEYTADRDRSVYHHETGRRRRKMPSGTSI